LARWERAKDKQSIDGSALAKAQIVCKEFTRVTRSSPVGRPLAQLLRGTALYLGGKKRRAKREWHRAIRAAERLGLQHTVGLGWYELGKRSGQEDPERGACLARAEEIFARLGATSDLGRVRVTLRS